MVFLKMYMLCKVTNTSLNAVVIIITVNKDHALLRPLRLLINIVIL